MQNVILNQKVHLGTDNMLQKRHVVEDASSYKRHPILVGQRKNTSFKVALAICSCYKYINYTILKCFSICSKGLFALICLSDHPSAHLSILGHAVGKGEWVQSATVEGLRMEKSQQMLGRKLER